MPREIEAKIALRPGELELLRGRLQEAGARNGSVDEEENLLFDSKGRRLRRKGRSLRLRSYHGRRDALLTCKGPVSTESAFKSREESEVSVADGETAREILEQLGFLPVARYSKRREQWHLDETEITLDRLDFGDYVEVEGAEAAIVLTLTRLGLEGRPHVPRGYADLARRHGHSTNP